MTTVDPGRDAMAGREDTSSEDAEADLRELVADLGARSRDRLTGRRSRPARIDEVLWSNLEATGLSRLTTTAELEAGPAQAAVVLHELASFACPVPVAETDLLGAWLAAHTALTVPESGALTIGFGVAVAEGDVLRATVSDVPWAGECVAVLAVLTESGRRSVAVIDPSAQALITTDDLAGEPRGRIEVSVSLDECAELSESAYREMIRRGAWARSLQTLGSLQSAMQLTVSHTRDREQFGRSLSKFQSVQHQLAAMAGSLDKARASVALAVAAAADTGFASEQTDFAVAVAKVTLGHCVDEVVSAAHQLHGAIGVTGEHELWLHTMRARRAMAEFGSPRRWSQRLGELLLTSDNSWDVLTAAVGPGSDVDSHGSHNG
ncbi:acyl-CoA dehydrogenase family protein [Rhodococcoides yunnanense]|uniref:Acyl-CoA dehydrogenase family protein n=1 Tax=Rhodococcoides yunnanense TaxID=278209 RepID=A0ABU4BKF0_9NOCA|nr:acyl-CoA dehydrogenase family protein [Rhodococcus yunnanensis]MDV6264703.1 acyl-CoA dehydrogenase family protein [Rhodococcus yunnanensis]